MERLWAPWRSEYIKKKDKEKVCVFCVKKVKKKQWSNYLILDQSTHSFVIMNKFPYSSGHLMVIPLRHTAKFENLSSAEGADIFLLLQKSIKVLKKTLKPQGYNVGLNLERAGGAGITKHLHYHVVPRWVGDTNFMPVIGDHRVIPQSLQRIYKHLAPHFKR
jgi:ATP adenylyltransferase